MKVTKLPTHLAYLRLADVAANYETLPTEAAAKNWTHVEYNAGQLIRRRRSHSRSDWSKWSSLILLWRRSWTRVQSSWISQIFLIHDE